MSTQVNIIFDHQLNWQNSVFSRENNYADLPAEGAFINILGLVFVVFAGLTVYLVSQERYKRLAQPEDDVLLNTRN